MSWPTAKRAIDAVLAAIALAALAPVLLVVAAAVAIALGRPVLFRQNRAGRGGEPFSVLKFRSMREPDPARGILSDADRLTPFGRFLRSTSLDELPSLWNVLRGDMSIVGPRPLPVAYLPRYSAEQARRHDVRPGITGLAQVCGRNSLSWEEKFALDVEYVEDASFALDLRILCATVGVVLRRDGISAAGEATAAEFRGSRMAADV
ncbi:sugar transferase [Virgisporangium aurantiacum]|uniref:UDP-phosphate galactose phosphotransferase n=1 Tax=Virgisporangium aurantiacum TaxID=175570 RepID=A0A8J3Z0C7_9ACTN|nr:sugar transferase [Virgisporangium aurantiacum]GIJ53988.1 UDP-phosphate galactose phosphotransferase [Virgisporangium aurantiacum]